MSELLQGIANLTKQVQQTLNSYEVRKIGDKVQGYVMNFTETEQKVREATNEDPWGPTGPEMQEIASLTFQYDQFSEVMGMLWKRMLQDNKMAWRRVYKSLILLNHLLKNGSERVINATRDHLFEMRSLENYKCVDERGKDEGVNVRHRVKLIMELLNDEELLRTERRKAKTEGREKYQGYSKEDMIRGGSKFDSFERWNEKKDKMDFDKKNREYSEFEQENGIGHREVTAFDFDTENSHSNANGSPELGIRERTPEHMENNDDDEEFGDFTSARATTRLPNSSIAAFSAHSAKLKSPQSAQNQRPQPTSLNPSNLSSGGNEIDLLGLGSQFNSTEQFAVKQKQQPSNNVIDEIFSTLPVASNANPKPSNGHNIPDIIDLLTPFPHSEAKTPQTPQSEYGYTLDNILKAPSDVSSNNDNNARNNSTKLSKTWEDLGRVNIDFDNLTLKSCSKAPGKSLNELKIWMATKSDSGNHC